LKPCSNPLDAIDVEALASGSEPLLDPGAAFHAAACDGCREAVARARALGAVLPEAFEPEGALAVDLAGRVLRLRPFSRAERTSLSLWKAPLLVTGGLFAAGLSLVAGSGLGARDQVGLAAALAAAAAALPRAVSRWAAELAGSAPAGLEGLSAALHGETALGWAALLLLVPAAFGLRRALVRAHR
jgi:hypothetical protein